MRCKIEEEGGVNAQCPNPLLICSECQYECQYAKKEKESRFDLKKFAAMQKREK